MRSAPYIWGGTAIGLGIAIALEYRRRSGLGRLTRSKVAGNTMEKPLAKFPTLADYKPGQYVANTENGGDNGNPPD